MTTMTPKFQEESHTSFSLSMPTSHGSYYSNFSHPDEASTRQTLLAQCVRTNRMRSLPYAKRGPQVWRVVVLLPRRGPVSKSCHTGYMTYSMSLEEAEKFTYVRMEKVLLRRDVKTASFLAKFEAGQESARNKGGQHLPGTKRR